MIFGKLTLSDTALHTHADSYMLETITAVSTRRPFLSAGLIIGGLSALFGLSFGDLLYPEEITALAVIGTLALTGGWGIGQLQLVSRDLKGSPIADAVYGTYPHLRRLRPQIVATAARAKAERPSG